MLEYKRCSDSLSELLTDSSQDGLSDGSECLDGDDIHIIMRSMPVTTKARGTSGVEVYYIDTWDA